MAYNWVLRDQGVVRGGGFCVASPQSGRWPCVAPATWLPFRHTEVTLSTPCGRLEGEDPISPHPSVVRCIIYVHEGFRFLLTVARSFHEIFCPATQIHDNIQHGSQLERVCRRRHQVDCHETLATTTGTRKRRVEPHANCTSHKNKECKSEQHDSVIAAIDRLREGALAKDLGLGRS